MLRFGNPLLFSAKEGLELSRLGITAAAHAWHLKAKLLKFGQLYLCALENACFAVDNISTFTAPHTLWF